MNHYTSNSNLQEVARVFSQSSSIALLTHSKPDGDALGSVLALCRAARQRGAEARVLLVGPVAPNLRTLFRHDPVEIISRAPARYEPDRIILCDTGARSQVAPLDAWLEERLERTIVLDHHVNGDILAPIRMIEPRCASTTQLIYELFQHLEGETFTSGPFGTAEALFIGLATDTGWFRFNSATAETLRVAADLVEHGADKTRIYRLVEENDRPERLALKARALRSIEFIGNYEAAVMSLAPRDFQETGGSTEDLVGIVNEPLSIGSVRVSVLISAVDDDRSKLSFRSKPPLEPTDVSTRTIDVNRLASRFQGGGHVHAAGARIDAPVDQACETVIKALEGIFCGNDRMTDVAAE